jgi:hypothetical protein
MAECFCGCGRRVRLLDRSTNKRGQEATELRDLFQDVRDQLASDDGKRQALELVIPIADNTLAVEARIDRLQTLASLCASDIHRDGDLPADWWANKEKLKPIMKGQREVLDDFERLLRMPDSELEDWRREAESS